MNGPAFARISRPDAKKAGGCQPFLNSHAESLWLFLCPASVLRAAQIRRNAASLLLLGPASVLLAARIGWNAAGLLLLGATTAIVRVPHRWRQPTGRLLRWRLTCLRGVSRLGHRGERADRSDSSDRGEAGNPHVSDSWLLKAGRSSYRPVMLRPMTSPLPDLAGGLRQNRQGIRLPCRILGINPCYRHSSAAGGLPRHRRRCCCCRRL
jgi:hypothetical protein